MTLLQNKEKVTSLSNECLRTGPSLTPLLFEVLLLFGVKPIALVGNVKKAFHQIEVAEKDRNCLRFLWTKDPASEPLEIKEYRFTRVI